MTEFWRSLGAANMAFVVAIGYAASAHAVERISVNVLNERDFKLSVELRDKMCGGNVVLRDQLEAGESREIAICANAEGIGGLRASYGSGCSQVKRTEFLDIAAGDQIIF